MSVNFVTKKLEGQSLGEQFNDIVEKVSRILKLGFKYQFVIQKSTQKYTVASLKLFLHIVIKFDQYCRVFNLEVKNTSSLSSCNKICIA